MRSGEHGGQENRNFQKKLIIDTHSTKNGNYLLWEATVSYCIVFINRILPGTPGP